ncbi:protein phosphatase 2C domain-containing protein [Glycomyces rhizosphaerae]|uniref:Protein phosphatase 2C domain-containing protein n=1 Tax=Glycomyces rhizosphaerae TaxID=2054422 RepID=A0ABV7Q3S7_9ACTN
MKVTAYSSPGSPAKPNEDYFLVDPTTAIVLDGATARTDTGCIHGADWFATNLGNALKPHVSEEGNLRRALELAIEEVAERHRGTCDLTHPGTPSAAVAIISVAPEETRWLLLGDATILFETSEGRFVKSDQRGRLPIPPEQQEADKYLIGDPRKDVALQAMKRAELATRNTPDGFWVAAADSSIAYQALIGGLPTAEIEALVIMSDGAARAVDLFHLVSWEEFGKVAFGDGPQAIIDAVREVEKADPVGERWPRNKPSDDATIIACKLGHERRSAGI